MDNIEQLFPGYCALILAEIARWREYDPAINPDIVDSFRSAVVGHRDRYRAKLEQLKFANADSRKQLDQIEQEVFPDEHTFWGKRGIPFVARQLQA